MADDAHVPEGSVRVLAVAAGTVAIREVEMPHSKGFRHRKDERTLHETPIGKSWTAC